MVIVVFEAFPVIFIHVRHFTIPHDGLVFIGIGIGSVIATLINIWLLRPYPQLMKEWRGFPPPEKRLYSAMVGTPLLAVSIFWLGWTGNYESVPWYVPALSTIPLGTGIALVFMSFLVRSTLLPYRNAMLTEFGRSELPRGHLPNVFRIRVRSQHNGPLRGRRCIPAVYDADVRRDGRQLGINPHRRCCLIVITNSVPLL